jgi:hypothetical protein
MSQPSPGPDRPFDLERALLSPSSVFRAPEDVLEVPGLSDGQRRAILEQWALDALRLEASEDEGMPGGEPARLRQVSLLLAQLAPPSDPSAPPSSGAGPR